jgi:hypothetical protein
MKNQELQTVSFEQAMRLKELGFDWETEKFYIAIDEYKVAYPFYVRLKSFGYMPQSWNTSKIASYKDLISAPTVSHALKWFRDVKKINAFVMYDDQCKTWFWCIKSEKRCPCKTFEQAETKLLTYLSYCSWESFVSG